MSLKNSNLDKNILNIGSQILGMKDADNILGAMKDIGNGEDLAKALVLGGITDKDTLANIAKQTDLVDSFDDLTDMMDSFADSQKGLKGTGNALKTIGQNALNAVGGVKMLLGSLSLIGIVVGAIALDDFLHIDYGEAHEAMDEAQSKYDETTSSLEDLRSEAETTTSRIKELEELQASDGLSIVEENELNTLKAQNEELDRQIKLKEQLQAAQGKQLADAAKEAMTKGTHSVAQSVNMGDSTGESNFRGDVEDTTDQQEVQDSIDLINQYKDKVVEIEKAIADEEQKIAEQKDKFTAEQYKKKVERQKEELKHYQDSIDTLYANIDTRAASMQENLDALKLDPEANVEEIKELEEALYAIAEIDMTDTEKKLNRINKFFDGSKGKNYLKEHLIDVVKNGGDAAVEIERMGIDLSDAGINAQALSEYFREIRDSATEAEESISVVEGTLSSIQSAGESANKDSTWKNVVELFDAAKELDKNKKWGTDDFKSMAQFMAPDSAKLKETKGELSADDYTELWKKYYKNFSKYFNSEKPLQSAINAQEKLVSEGLAKRGTDGIIRFTEAFESSADAADAWGVSVEAAEIIMQNLESHGYEFEGIRLDGAEADRYTNALENLKTLYESMDNGDEKGALYRSIFGKGGWQDQLDELDGDLTKITEDQVIKIEFEYSLAQLKADLLEARQSAYEGGGTESWAQANSTAYAIREDLEEQTGVNESSDKGYKESYNQIETLQKNIVGKSEEHKELIQEQVALIYDMQIAYQEALYSGEEVDWKEFLNQQGFENLYDEIVSKLEAAGVDVSGLNIPVSLEYRGTVTPEAIESQLAGLAAGSTITFRAETDEGSFYNLEAKLNQDGTVTYYSLLDDGTKEEVSLEVKELGTVEITAVNNTESGVGEAGDEIDSLPKEVTTKMAFDNFLALWKIERTKTKLDDLDGKEIDTYITQHISTEGDHDYTGSIQAKGTVHHKGTARVLGIRNDIPEDALTNSSYRTEDDDVALTGELGREIVVHGDKWWTVGENGAEFAHIPSNSIVFNHKQTEELLGKGKTKSRGRVHANGTAFLEGNAYAGIDLKTNPTGTSNKNGKDKDNDKSKNDSEKYDWIEKLLQKIQRSIENLSKTADATYKKWSTRNDAISDQIKEVRKEKSKTELAKERYEKEAKNVGLEKKYRDLVKNGKISIQSIKDEKTREKIEEYTKWQDKIKECEASLEDLADTEASLYMQAFDNVAAKYDAILERTDWRQSMLDEYISQAEAKGQIVSAEYYQGKIKGEENRLGYLTKERDALYKKLEQAVDNGIEVGSEDWNTMVNEINAVTLEIESAETAILEFENNIRDCEWEAFDKLQEQISNITDEAEFLIELMSNDDMYDDDGKLTEEGLATMGLHGQNYNVYMEQAAQYAEEIKKLEEDIAKDPKNQDLIERKQELIELQRESILAAEDEKQAIVDMVEEGINKELEALQELIDKKKEELQSQKELYEYQKKMKDLTKEQASVQKQLAAYQGDTSEENKARLQQLKVQLEESQEAIEEAEYEKYMSDQEELLDSMYEEYEEMLNARLDNVDALIEETIHEINASAGDIQKTLEEQASEVGITLSDEMNSIWSGADGEKSVLSTFEQGVATGLTTVNSTLETMNTNLIGMITALNKIANTDVKGIPTENAFNSDEAKFAKNVDGLTQGDGHLKDKVKDLLDNKNNTTNKNNKNNKNNKDNKITKGEKVTFKSGKYTARADGTGASGKQKLGEKVYVTSIKSGAKRPYHIAQDKAGKKPLGWVKKEQLKGYYTGVKNIDKDQWAITQEKGLEAIMHNGSILTPLAKGSSVFNADATDNLYDFMNNPYEFIKANIDLQQLSSVPRLHEFGNYEYSGDMSFELILPNVTNYEEFKYAMKHDKDIERFIQSVSVDKMMGKSSLRKYK